MTGGTRLWKPTVKHRCVTPLLILCVAGGLLASSAQAGAEVTATDLHVVGRALSFMTQPFVGETRLGIVFDPANVRSAQQARRLEAMLGNGMEVGNVTLMPVSVPVSEMATADVDLFFMTEHLEAPANDVSHAARKKGIPCITVDMRQVQSGACVMGVRSAPKVEILVNRKAAEATGTQFATVFRMMITEF